LQPIPFKILVISLVFAQAIEVEEAMQAKAKGRTAQAYRPEEEAAPALEEEAAPAMEEVADPAMEEEYAAEEEPAEEEVAAEEPAAEEGAAEVWTCYLL
jgi:hypothetical protein